MEKAVKNVPDNPEPSYLRIAGIDEPVYLKEQMIYNCIHEPSSYLIEIYIGFNTKRVHKRTVNYCGICRKTDHNLRKTLPIFDLSTFHLSTKRRARESTHRSI